MEKNNSHPKILLYTGNPRAFRTTSIGYLYEIAAKYPVFVVSEKLDSETEGILQDKKLFPGVEEIIPISQFTGERMSLFSKNKYLYRLAGNIIKQYRPDIIISPSDTHSLFELYLMRFAKRKNILKITIQVDNIGDTEESAERIDLTNSYLKFPSFLPFWLRFFLVKCRKYFGHFLYYWIFPIMVGEKPFFGKSSHILRKGISGMRDADYQIAFSERDYNVYFKNGVPDEKLYILAHPLSLQNTAIFEKFQKADQGEKNKKDAKVISLILPNILEFGFRKADHSLITYKEREEVWNKIIKSIQKILPGYQIYVKPHPAIENIDHLRKILEQSSKNIKIADPQEPADKYIEISDIIIGLPLSVSTVLFTASLQCPEKPILSLDFFQEMIGDNYKNFDGIEYIDNEGNFIETLTLIRDNQFQKKYQKNTEEKAIEKSKKFSNAVEMLERLFYINKTIF